MTDRMTADDLRAWLDRTGLSRTQLAELLDRTPGTIYAMLSGARRCPADLAAQLAALEASGLPAGRAGDTTPLTNPRVRPPAPKRPRGRPPRKAAPDQEKIEGP